VVHAFTVASGVKFPYDMGQLQTQTIAELKDKTGHNSTLFRTLRPISPGAMFLTAKSSSGTKATRPNG